MLLGSSIYYYYTNDTPEQLHQSFRILNLAANTYHLLQKVAILNTCRLVRKFL